MTEQLIDVDSHVIEPPDLWTSRVSAKKWGNLVPHVRRDEKTGEDLWYIGDEAMMAAAQFAMVGWEDIFPQYPPTMDDIDPAMYDGVARLKLLDDAGIQAQIFYPNLVAGFFAQQFAEMDPDLALECVRAYNDFQTDFASPDPDRLIALTALPFWDVEASVKEIERGAEMGHRGVLFAHTFDAVGLPSVASAHWHPILDAAQALGQSINFHVGFAVYADRSTTDIVTQTRSKSRMDYASGASLGFLSNARAINLLLLYGVCARYPDLKFVCVESGFGFVPYQLQALDWQWDANGLAKDHPDRLLPSEYFRRQVYATLWFEQPTVADLDTWQDNVMWETDYPHPTAQWPTPTSALALGAAEAVDYSFGGISAEVRQKVVHDNAAALYRIP